MPRHQCSACRTHQRAPEVLIDGEALCAQCGGPLAPVTDPAQLVGLRAAGPGIDATRISGGRAPDQTFLARRGHQLERERARWAAATRQPEDDPADAIAVSLPVPRP